MPVGVTRFHFPATNLVFHSTSYESLEISGHKAIYVGEGQINRSGHFGFLLSAIDGALDPGGGPDRLRIRIWDKDNGDALIYDLQLVCGDPAATSDPCSVIGGGDIGFRR